MAPAELCSIKTYEGEKNVVGPPKTDVIDVDQLKCISAVNQFVDELEEEGPQAKKRKKNTKEENGRENNDQESDINTTNNENNVLKSQLESANISEVKSEMNEKRLTEKNELDDDKSKDEGYLFIYFL